MKIIVLALALLIAPALPAQETAPSPVNLAQIDPAALNLLARMSWKYRNILDYDTLINITRSDESTKQPVVRRFRTYMGTFAWSQWSPDNRWMKWIFDNKTVIGYNSAFPKRYTKREFADFSGRDYTPILESLGLNIALLPRVMSGDWPGQLLAHPDLHQVSMASEKGQSIVTLKFRYKDSFEGQDDFVRFAFDPQTLLLSRINTRQTIFSGSETRELKTDETYSQASFRPQLSASSFDIRPPLNYKLIGNFYGPNAKP